MNQLSSFPPLQQSREQTSDRTSLSPVPRLASLIAIALSVTTLSACSSISEVTKERVASSTVAVTQTEQTLGRSEDGMMELQRAKESLAAAQAAVTRTDDKAAQRFASQAQLHAELAVAQSQSAAARRAADEVLASTNALRKETERSDSQSTTSPNTP